ncbi:MAG TPA: hypothetical protein VF157_01515 [Chloroflexota bacterium]
MVSNVLGIEPDELVARLAELRAQHAADPEYQQLRADLPEGWPV